MANKQNEDSYKVSVEYIRVNYLNMGYFVITMIIIDKVAGAIFKGFF